jgi:hypothetical protein
VLVALVLNQVLTVFSASKFLTARRKPYALPKRKGECN